MLPANLKMNKLAKSQASCQNFAGPQKQRARASARENCLKDGAFETNPIPGLEDAVTTNYGRKITVH